MTNEEKQLLFIDLCARVPYGVKVSITAHNLDYDGITHTCFITCYDEFKTQGNDIDTIKPYLRPMSSMTVEEKEEYDKTFDWDYSIQRTPFDWLHAHHFDYRGLIDKGLALEAPADMYKTE